MGQSILQGNGNLSLLGEIKSVNGKKITNAKKGSNYALSMQSLNYDGIQILSGAELIQANRFTIDTGGSGGKYYSFLAEIKATSNTIQFDSSFYIGRYAEIK